MCCVCFGGWRKIILQLEEVGVRFVECVRNYLIMSISELSFIIAVLFVSGVVFVLGVGKRLYCNWKESLCGLLNTVGII